MINTNLKFWRRELSLTQAQIAEKLGIKRSLVGAYEEGRAEPKLTTLVNMARLFGISLDQLVTTDFSKRKTPKRPSSCSRPRLLRWPKRLSPTGPAVTCAFWPSR
ncbi:helix-turn-helix transcriptional regulator [Hymenobacter sp. J193]|uniref:helix-turn-helix transcriptional regulator n=1 Tax=Hymenobacter sp. J193 TaxID=2898429 RepID=UPI002151FA93|nr:helix-turn-helix transcriptional regulator [Hymenobacter sp. J193]MCR5889774.1 helix-turn-helix transcriptional regulator [Hymenobacter sp. J193]